MRAFREMPAMCFAAAIQTVSLAVRLLRLDSVVGRRLTIEETMRREYHQRWWEVRDGYIRDLYCLLLDERNVRLVLKHRLSIEKDVYDMIP
jgi:hypothetical protein